MLVKYKAVTSNNYVSDEIAEMIAIFYNNEHQCAKLILEKDMMDIGFPMNHEKFVKLIEQIYHEIEAGAQIVEIHQETKVGDQIIKKPLIGFEITKHMNSDDDYSAAIFRALNAERLLENEEEL